MSQYLSHGKLKALPAHGEELAAILLEASKRVAMAKGCNLYVVSIDPNEADSVFVTEIWDSKEDHDNSLNIQDVRDLIMRAIPILNGKTAKGQELEVLGGLGI
jgi:quinol monooxygenase YgiN